MFGGASAITALGGGRYAASFDDTWFQGLGVYGGLSGAVLLRAMAAEVGERPPRTLSVQYATTVAAGPATVEVAVERRGTGMAFASARLVQDGVRIHGVASFGNDRDGGLDEEPPPMAEAPPPSAVPSFPWRPPFPAFLQHFETRLVDGMPYSGAPRSGVRMWARSAYDEPLDDFLLIGLLDVPAPAILPRATTLRPVSTVVWHVQFFGGRPLPGGSEPVFLDVGSDVTRAGYSNQDTRLYGIGGRLLAHGRQLVAVIR